VTGGVNTGWYTIGGTSAGTPQWAALVAIANQGRALFGESSLSGPDTLAAIYSMSASNFRDITSGSNGFAATAGYDLATGRGSPLAFPVIRDLVYYQITSAVPPGSGTGTSTASRSGISNGKGTQFQYKTALSPMESAFAPVGDLARFPTTVATASAPTPLFVGQVGQPGATFSTETARTALPRPKADAAWWRTSDTQGDHNLRSADETSQASAAGDVQEIEPAEPEDEA
jgi:hypothetical protein